MDYNNNNNNYKFLLRQYPRKESNSVAHLVHGLGKLTAQVQCNIHQQMIRWNGDLGNLGLSLSAYARIGCSIRRMMKVEKAKL